MPGHMHIDEGQLLDIITNKPIKDTPKEQVRQRIARALHHEYGLSYDDMHPDFGMKVDGRRKRIDIAIFDPGEEHSVEHLRRVVVTKKEPAQRRKGGAFRMRDHDQARKDLEDVKAAMEEGERCRWGMWTNGIEMFFVEKEKATFENRFKAIGDWPMGDESIGTRDVLSNAKLRRADPEMLKIAFRRCHNYIHGNEGMPKDAAFWQFLYLIFAKMHDEKRPRDQPPRFWAGPTEQFEPEGQEEIKKRINNLFAEVRALYTPEIFRGTEEITLSNRSLAAIVSELAKYDFGRTDVDAKGVAYQEIVGNNLRGDRGQYFTPRGAIQLVVEILDPQPGERVLDPACGTGGFLVATIAHMNRRFAEEKQVELGAESTEDFIEIRDRLAPYAKTKLYGADFDPFLVRAAQMNVVMASNTEANIYNMNSLEFPAGHLPGIADASKQVPLGSVDVVMTNPPFGSNIPITDPNILSRYELAHSWERTEEGGFKNKGSLQGSVSPEVLFIERTVGWLKPGGRAGLVLPDGILGNPGDEYIRWWILKHSWVLASIDLPVEVFIVEANVNILTSLLFLKKKTDTEMRAEALGKPVDYSVFMAVAEKVGVDRRGNTLSKRSPDGEVVLEEVQETEEVRIGGEMVKRTLHRKQKIIDNDLPYMLNSRYIRGPIADAFTAFRTKHPEPGS